MNFLQRLHDQVLVGDGAIGTMLYSRGVTAESGFERLNLTRPDLVLTLHADYIAAGAQLIETNTFAANRLRLQQLGLEDKVRQINLQGATLARKAAAGKEVFVAGSIGPLPRIRGESEAPSAEEITAIFREQAFALAEGGVDLLILETFADLQQMKLALAAARETKLPLITSMAFLERGRISGGMGVEAVALELAAAGADCIGANCGSGTLEMTRNIQRMAAITILPLAAYPNNGFPEYLDGRYMYRTTPEYFAARGLETAQAGANLVGGCCGTTPEHIRRLAETLRGMKPAARTIMPTTTPSHQPPIPAPPSNTGFLANWGRETVITVELDPPKGLDCSRVLEGSRILRDAGADAINLAENPLSRVRMGNIALAELIQREVGIEVIVHVTCRDRNLIGLQSELMGASLLGIRSILAVTGDPASMGEQSGASSVFDLNSFGLIALLRGLNSGLNGAGNSIDRGTGFTIGAAFNPNVRNMEAQVARLEKKIANGAQFVQTQPLFDVNKLDTMLQLTRRLPLPILPGILPLVSERNTEFLHNEVPGITIPDEIRDRMRGKGKEDGLREGLAIAREFIDAARNRVGGFYLIPPFGNYRIAAELVRYIRKQA
ncbi:MAG: bifunctional homocysteine S-methyltransferase/methylenetetrahydrofolate reductase [Deltaproteobacteria bacterium]|nr:bifunctional homocysteine S-methyltransferase/methylenetetrahydrofolate reductase [Deltaproteobacteria bacterium]